MENFTRIIKEYPKLDFRYTKGKIDIFHKQQFHPYYEIYLFLNGNVEFVSDHTRKKLTPYELIIIPPGKYHCLLTNDCDVDTYERTLINIYPDFIENEILEEAFLNKEFLSLSSENRIVQNFMHLKNCATQYNKHDFQNILSAITTDIIFLIKHCNSSLQNKTNNTLHPVSLQIMNYINDNYKSDIKVSDIAKVFSFSASAISRIFKEDFGVNIKRYITEKRMNEIYSLLQKGESALVVSSDFGFSNYSTFYRAFLSHFKKSPREIKKLGTPK